MEGCCCILYTRMICLQVAPGMGFALGLIASTGKYLNRQSDESLALLKYMSISHVLWFEREFRRGEVFVSLEPYIDNTWA